MQLKIKDAIQLYSSLQRLDTYQNDGKEIPFTLGAIRLDIARNMSALKPAVEAYEKARNDLIKQLSNGTGTLGADTDPAALKQFGEEVEKMLERSDEFKLFAIKQADLKLDINPIGVNTLAVMIETGLLD